RPGLADRLCRDHADRFTDIDDVAAAEIAAVARRAQTVARVAGERSAHLHLVDAQTLDLFDLVLAEQRTRMEQRRLRFWIHDVRCNRAPEDPLAKSLDHFPTLDESLHRHAVGRAAIFFGDDQVLGYVDETAREITRVCRLQRSVGESLAGSVRRVEV